MTTAKTTGETFNNNRRSESDLDHRYGRIAISALVAALPYRGETRKHDAASSETRKDRAA